MPIKSPPDYLPYVQEECVCSLHLQHLQGTQILAYTAKPYISGIMYRNRGAQIQDKHKTLLIIS